MPLWQAIHLSWPIYDWVSKMNPVVCQAWLPIYFLPFLMHATYTIYLHQVGRPNIYRWIEQGTREVVFTHMAVLGYQKFHLVHQTQHSCWIWQGLTLKRIKSDLRLSDVGLITIKMMWIRMFTYYSIRLCTCAHTGMHTLLVQYCKKKLLRENGGETKSRTDKTATLFRVMMREWNVCDWKEHEVTIHSTELNL